MPSATAALPETRNLRIIGSGRSHDVLRNILSRMAPGHVLDVPCGTGVLSDWLIQSGWNVHCADIDQGNFQLDASVAFTQIDLNRELPFEDNTFEYVISANGMHRAFFPRGAISEIARVLRPGGVFVLNMNNYYSIVNRMRVLLCGSPSYIFENEVFEQTVDVPEAQVRFAYPFSQIVAYLAAAGMVIDDVYAADKRRRHHVVGQLCTPLRWLGLGLSRWCRNPELIRWNAHPAIFGGGAYFVVVARKANLAIEESRE